MRGAVKNSARRKVKLPLPVDGKTSDVVTLAANVAAIIVAVYFLSNQLDDVRSEQRFMQQAINAIERRQVEQGKDIEYIRNRQQDLEQQNNKKQRGKDE